MGTKYLVRAVLVHHTSDHSFASREITHEIPAFLLDADLHGITDKDHAVRVARKVICPIDPAYESVTVNVTAERVDDDASSLLE